MAAATWEFWIDVGGTFTDCLAKAPDGAIRRHKLLSSGVTKGRVGPGSSQHAILDSARQHFAALKPPHELVAEDLRAAHMALSAITGEFTSDDLLGVIFSRFCIGK